MKKHFRPTYDPYDTRLS